MLLWRFGSTQPTRNTSGPEAPYFNNAETQDVHCVGAHAEANIPPCHAPCRSPTQLRCVTLPTLQIGASPVYVVGQTSVQPLRVDALQHGTCASWSVIVFRQRHLMNLLRPNIGPSRGGTVVAVFGLKFPLHLSTRCFFGYAARHLCVWQPMCRNSLPYPLVTEPHQHFLVS